MLNNLRQKKRFRVTTWKVAAGLLAWASAYLAELDWQNLVLVVTLWTLMVDQLMKAINTKLLWDLWVEK